MCAKKDGLELWHLYGTCTRTRSATRRAGRILMR
jgi:hypothetical protein